MKAIRNRNESNSDRFYFYQNGKVDLPLVPNKILLTFKDELNAEEADLLVQNLDNRLGIVRSINSRFSRLKDVQKYLLLDLDDNAVVDSKGYLDFNLNQDKLVSISNVFKGENNTLLALTNQLFVKLKNDRNISELHGIFKDYSIEETQMLDENFYLLTLVNNDSFDALEVANIIFELECVEFSDPNFFRMANVTPFAPNDPEYPGEWQIPKMGVNDAWCWNKGAGVKIGIMDVGINVSHPDLISNYVGTYDPTGRGLGYDSHGTLCAGAALAVGNNSIGIAGVAFDASLYQLRIGYNPTTNPNELSFVSTDAWVVNGFNYARNNSIDIVSCSFSFGSPTNSINSSITSFTTNGRNNLGGVVLAASGNDASINLGYPASLKGTVIAVGASDFSDQRAAFSNYNTNVLFSVDVVAPGIYIPSTSYDGYYTSFSGTSVSTPLVAGIVALMLANQPSLTRNQLITELYTNCDHPPFDPLDPHFFPVDPYGVRNIYVGNGRVNIKNYFEKYYRISGPNNFCSSSAQYSISSLPSGISVTWSSSNLNMPIDTITGVLTNLSGNSDETLITAVLSNTCISPKSKIVVAGTLGSEIYCEVFENNPSPNQFNMAWGKGNSIATIPLRNNTYSVSLTLIYFGWAPSIGKSTLVPPITNMPYYAEGWIPDNTLSILEIISKPANWYADIYGYSLFVGVTGDATGQLVLRMSLPCGESIVTFNYVGVV